MGNEISQCVEDMSGASEDDIHANANKEEGEIAAGWLYQKSDRSMKSKVQSAGGGRNLMRRSWFVLRAWPDCTLTSYKDKYSPTPTGVTQLLKADVKSKQVEDDKFHFAVHHSSHGSKHLFAETSSEMNAWMMACMEVIQLATSMGGMEGLLKKRGGIRLHTWQQRWFMLMGGELSWYEKPSDAFPRGSIMLNPQVQAIACEKEVGSEKYVFEIVDSSRHDSKRRREFACETVTDRKFWVAALNRSIEVQMQEGRTKSVSRASPTNEDEEDGEGAEAPPTGFFSSLVSGISQRVNSMSDNAGEDEDPDLYMPNTKVGVLEKNNTWGVMQKRYFECSSGELRYYKTQEAFDEKKKEPARIYLGDLLKGSPSLNPVDHRGIYLATDNKIYSLKAESEQDAQEWLENIEEWKAFLNVK
jgi:hypothetical protein